MKFFYSLGVNAYSLSIRIASLWNSKARDWVNGRKNQWTKIDQFSGDNVVWFHCASLGEFEQARPVIERLKKDGEVQVVITFFSPSGFNVRKNYEGADLIVYLPKDSTRNAKRFIGAINPKKIYFVKYEFWASYIFEAKSRAIPTYSIAALFRENHLFFKFYGGFQRSILKAFTKILVQNKSSQDLLSTIDIPSEICGDTRFDRVLENADKVEKYTEIEAFCGAEKVLVCGSVWKEDLSVISSALAKQNELKIIIAPHELSESIYNEIERGLDKKSIRYSNLSETDENEQVLIIDNIGMLMNIYQYGNFAYVGGGLKTGLHNILEPAAFGLPTIFGNRTDKFPEAKIFVDKGIGFQISDSLSFEKALNFVKDKNMKSEVLDFMNSQTGATEIILQKT